MTLFICTHCKRIKPTQVSGGTGYGINKANEKVCYVCCAKQELASMLETGKATLYFTSTSVGVRKGYKVTDWTGELSFKVYTMKTSKHNMARVRYDYWFRTPDNKLWHGYTIGDFTQIAHCKQVKG